MSKAGIFGCCTPSYHLWVDSLASSNRCQRCKEIHNGKNSRYTIQVSLCE